MLVCVFLSTLARETAGAARTRSSPRPLLRVACALFFLGRTNLQNSGAVSRENVGVCCEFVEHFSGDARMTAEPLRGVRHGDERMPNLHRAFARHFLSRKRRLLVSRFRNKGRRKSRFWKHPECAGYLPERLLL